MSSYYKQVCSNCSATESNNWKKVEELGTWVCSNCFDDIIAENASSDEEATSQITTRKCLRVTRSARIYPPQTSSTHQDTERGRRWIFKKKIPCKNTKRNIHPFTSNELQSNAGVLFRAGDVVRYHINEQQIRYAQLRKFMRIYEEKRASVLWLLPTFCTDCYPETDFNPSDYTAGKEDELTYSLECMTFVMHLPTNFFKEYLQRVYRHGKNIIRY
ncbi:GATA zinc finger domain-containing protein 1 [Nilaparvata lugens]|uniref:GATA zinc finger domain-containing protein 1 n=1 Tax=Nilaparvata lugens TaxID=108931 RepID=UPI00193E9FEC|nr:GATA zinc finger domain-containing protein 1 [Nilaparvata lugens]